MLVDIAFERLQFRSLSDWDWREFNEHPKIKILSKKLGHARNWRYIISYFIAHSVRFENEITFWESFRLGLLSRKGDLLLDAQIPSNLAVFFGKVQYVRQKKIRYILSRFEAYREIKLLQLSVITLSQKSLETSPQTFRNKTWLIRNIRWIKDNKIIIIRLQIF